MFPNEMLNTLDELQVEWFSTGVPNFPLISTSDEDIVIHDVVPGKSEVRN